jgi:TetR/AcrR family transcriptional regulator
MNPLVPTHHRPGPRKPPEQTRAAILEAALREFADEGLEGARTDAIAAAAGVNKALLYYYFADKEALYGAVLEQIFKGLTERLQEAMERARSPREAVLNYAGAHFDYIASCCLYPRLVQREFMRAGRRPSPHLERIVEHYFRPLLQRLERLIRQGITAGEFRRVNAQQFVISMVGIIVFYFNSLPTVEVVTGFDPLAPERIRERRRAVIDFLTAALFKKAEKAERKTGKRQ